MHGIPPWVGLAAAVAVFGLCGWSIRAELAQGVRVFAGREPASRANLSARYWTLIFAALVAMLPAVAVLMLFGAPGWPLFVGLALVAVALGFYAAALILGVVGRRRK